MARAANPINHSPWQGFRPCQGYKHPHLQPPAHIAPSDILNAGRDWKPCQRATSHPGRASVPAWVIYTRIPGVLPTLLRRTSLTLAGIGNPASVLHSPWQGFSPCLGYLHPHLRPPAHIAPSDIPNAGRDWEPCQRAASHPGRAPAPARVINTRMPGVLPTLLHRISLTLAGIGNPASVEEKSNQRAEPFVSPGLRSGEWHRILLQIHAAFNRYPTPVANQERKNRSLE